MYEKRLKEAAICSFAFMLIVLGCAWYLNSHHQTGTEDTINTGYSNEHENVWKETEHVAAVTEKVIEEKSGETTLQAQKVKAAEKGLGNHYIKIKKPDSDIKNIKLLDAYMEQKIYLFFDYDTKQVTEDGGNTDTVMSDIVGLEDVSWISDGNDYFYKEGQASLSDTIQGVDIEENIIRNTDNFSKTMTKIAEAGKNETIDSDCQIGFKLNEIYDYGLYTDAENIYIALRPLREVYDTILVVDAGHGGKDTGSYAAFGEETEKDFNLSIVKRLREYLKQDETIKVFYTRLTDKKIPLEQRVSLANRLKADLFLSVHCNSNEETPEANGIEVLYQNEGEAKQASKKFASILLHQLVEKTNRRKRSVLKGNNIYIVRNAKIPVALAEVGFLNNREELCAIQSEEGQEAIAQGLYDGILKMLEGSSK